jgi:NADPH:quinone reductase-like Zn-dependent oxidoreductase
MRAARIRDGALVVEEVPDPVAGSGEVVVRVHAAGLNNADRLQIAGLYPAPPGSPPDIPGLEIAGEVESTGPGALRFSPGDRVMAVVGGGAMAERCVVHERTLIPVPANLPWAEAGGFPEAFTTAHDALVTQCGLVTGERLLVHGAAGGVGIAGVQIGAVMGCSVTATVRSPELRDRVAGLGASAVVAPDDFEAHGPYDVVLELIGAANLAGNIRALSTGGRISVIGVSAAGSKAEVDLLALMSKRATVRGSTLRTRPLEQKADAARRVEVQLLPHLETGRLHVPVEAELPLAEVNEAYARFAAGGKFGKLVVTM